MPEISRFASGVVIKMYYREHNPPHFHAEHAGEDASFDFQGSIIADGLSSRAAIK